MNLRKKLANLTSQLGMDPRKTLTVALVVLLLATSVGKVHLEQGVRSADQYWQNTALSSGELEAFLSARSCAQSAMSMLGCVNALSAMAEKLNLVLTLDGRFEPMSSHAIEERLTEKKELSLWEAKLNQPEVDLGFEFLDLWQRLDSNFVRPQERSAVVAAGMNAFLSVTKDPHTYILPFAMYEDVIARSDSKPIHLGFISKRIKGGAFVRKVFEGSPAARAGLKKGDRILEVNGEKVSSLHPLQYGEMMRAQGRERLRLLVERKGPSLAPVRHYFEIFKSDGTYPNVLSKMLVGEHQVGIMTIHKFAKETCLQTRIQLQGLMEEGARGLILDLRDNPGGQVDEAACVLSLFVEKGRELFQTRYLDPSRSPDIYRAHQEPLYRGPLSVLINGGSASASEIVAGSLKDLGRARLVGERSFGKGSFQDGRLWQTNPKVAYFETEGFYYFPSGWTPQLVGLEPDVKVTSDEDEGFREEDLYYSTIRPSDLWNGPQSFDWINAENACPLPLTSFELDPQIEKAWSLMSCETRSSRL